LSLLDSGDRLAQDVAMDAANPLPQTPESPAAASRARRWLQVVGLLAAGVVLGLAFAAYGGVDLLLNFTNLRYCG
jgi:predicted lipid-binding transport protein (Tim44 family)